ncbi:HSP90 family protein [Mannheimia haemolytica]|uniref:HSP90 family protein n=1 Tax=Mannheimia haemolytica TaxID=75985 RepID=A0A3S4XQ09_MANHA|nr:ATP-binding protein [Mannheimia haemolytica]VEI78069.1 HSP90 family protein [Mannheimia haemolytica]
MNTQLNSLEQYFEQACGQHPQLQYLRSQWGFDKELISKALQNVGHIFPHYSRHDVSHSKQIIINIERLLGDKIQYLTATDMWLILEAAYSHDIGMVITQKQIEDMNSTAFNDFVQKLALDEKNELSSFAKKWVKDEAVLPQKAKAHDFFHQYIQLLAEWYRRKHPINSANIVINPREEIGLDSSRNELIPKRLFNILSKICKAHGDSFEQMIKELPKAEAGLGTEDCHPLYVACLLRMGDLLDIDDNRFCPVMMAMCSHNLPSLSQAHRDKHLSVQHFRLDSERIEVECACPNPESYEAAFDWFEWLKIEYHNQTQHWDQIVPSKQLGRLPTLMNPKVTIQQPYIIIDEGKKPFFQINKESMLHLIRGTGLYSSRFDSIREILQNAVDSTLYRIWIDHKNRYDFYELSPIDKRYLELVNKYKVDVSFEPEDINGDIWVLNVRDNGIGISLNDLRYMLNVGSTKYNDEKQKRLSEMPMWFRPSGAFGIGLQSAFLLADEFYITSYSIIDKKYLKIHFHKHKGVTIEELNHSDDIHYGCNFNVKIKVEKNPQRYTYSLENDMWKEIANGLKEYDITSSGFRLDFIEVNTIIGKIMEFNINSPVKVNVKKYGLNITHNKDDFYFYENIILSNLSFGDFNGRVNSFFRGQRFSDLSLSVPGLHCNVDVYSETSDKFLTYNREKILPEVREVIREKVYNVICKYISDKIDCIPEPEKPFAALSYFLLSKKAENKFSELIGRIKINKSSTLEKLINDIVVHKKKIVFIDRDYDKKFQNKQTIKNATKKFILSYLLWYITKKDMFYSIHKEIHKKDSYGNHVEKFIYTFEDDDAFPISNDYFLTIIRNKISHNDRGCRLFFPAWGKFRELSIRDDRFSYGDFFHYISYSTDYMILPIDFRFEMNEQRFFDDSENLVTWIYNNKKQENVSFEKIKELLQELIIELKEILSISAYK